MVKGKSLNAVRININCTLYIYDKNQQNNLNAYFSICSLTNSNNKFLYVSREHLQKILSKY